MQLGRVGDHRRHRGPWRGARRRADDDDDGAVGAEDAGEPDDDAGEPDDDAGEPTTTPAPTTTTTPPSDLPACPTEALDGASEPVEITFWHGLNVENEDALQQVTDQYNASQDRVVVTLQNQGGYLETIDDPSDGRRRTQERARAGAPPPGLGDRGESA